MANSPLNPTLYRALARRFGEHVVEIVSPGAAIRWQTGIRVFVDESPHRKVLVQGEEYKIPCPFCRDWKPRLFLNHMWGVWDEETRSRNLWLANCFNEGCTSSHDRQQQLFAMLFGGRRGVSLGEIRKGQTADPQPIKAELPGPVIRLDVLAAEQPDHHAVRYLESRHFDPAYLGRAFEVAYCPESRFRLAQDRIIIPVHECGRLVGWQARHIGDRVGETSLKDSGVPKYWTMPGMQRKSIGYNLERAARHQTIAIVEGPADVWGFGPQAFGLLGKTVHPLLVQKLRRWIDLYWGPQAVVVVLLDPNPDLTATRTGKPHHIEAAAERLRRGLGDGLRDRVLPVYLPRDTDPGSLDRGFLREIVRQRAREAGLPVCFGAEGQKPALPVDRLLRAVHRTPEA